MLERCQNNELLTHESFCLVRCPPPWWAHQSVLVESPVSLAVSPGVISLDPSLSELPLSAPASSVSATGGRKGGGAGGGKKGKKKKDPNEPQKPVSAYALFFRDTQAAIKGQNPNATFGEVSKIVASMWDSLGEEQKQVSGDQSHVGVCSHLLAATWSVCNHCCLPPSGLQEEK